MARILQFSSESLRLHGREEQAAMSGMNWQRRWDPFRDLQREMGRLFETFEEREIPRT